MTVPSPEELTAAIQTLTQEWLEQDRVPNIRTIGQGWCYHFAEEVMLKLGSEEHGSGYLPEDSFERLIDCVTEDWWARRLNPDGSDAGEAEWFTMDLRKLIEQKAPLPDGVQENDEDFATFLGSLTHNWLVLNGRHYDATCPEGADHFLLMPFFANQVTAFMSERTSAQLSLANPKNAV